MTGSEKPWYLRTVLVFLSEDVPKLLGLTPAAVARDILTLEHRVTMEGESFLTKTLPTFGKSLDYALQERAPLSVSGFCKRSRRSALPAFLQALTERVFSEDGHVLESPCIQTIRCLRQLFYWCKKVEKGFTDESLQKSIDEFKDIDRALPEVSIHTNPRLLGLARGVIRLILRKIAGVGGALPRHGPGAVAWDKGCVGKRRLRISYTNLERIFRPVPWFRSLRDVSENPQAILSRPQTEFGVSRLAFVEKDSSGPRLIGLEPAEYMWCQQALKSLLYDHIEKYSIAKGQINFTDQSINRNLVADWRRYDTLDMSSASDRNSLSLVQILFKGLPLYDALMASRTPGVVLPNGELFMYKKFAPMGSAVCFPVEAMVFYALAVASLKLAGYPFLLALQSTFVYGDDIVVPHGFFETLRSNFESVGLKFSDQKCCVSGKFRESCGLDMYDGQEVTPLRLRRPHLNKGVLDLISVVEHANSLMAAGYTAAARTLRKDACKRYQELRLLALPSTWRRDLPILTWLDFERDTVKYKYKNSLCFVKGWVALPVKVEADAADDTFFLRESLCHGGPVGDFKVSQVKGRVPADKAGNELLRTRVLTLRYQGAIVKKRLCIGDGRQYKPGLEPATVMEASYVKRMVTARRSANHLLPVGHKG